MHQPHTGTKSVVHHIKPSNRHTPLNQHMMIDYNVTAITAYDNVADEHFSIV